MEFVPRKTQIDYDRLKDSKLVFYEGMKAQRIFHYTSIGGLQGILEHKKLRFTNIKYMNDKDEISAGLESALKTSSIPEEQADKLCAALKADDNQIFLCCFSFEEDSLPMWNYYTKEINNQGYNIEFSTQKLIESILRENPVLHGCNFSFGRVDYSKDYFCYIKRECFKQEQEFRIVITVPNELLATLKKAGVYKFRTGNGILIPFLELAFSAEAVKSIMISPTIQSDLVELSIREFLQYCNFDVEDYSRFIRHSKVPVRF